MQKLLALLKTPAAKATYATLAIFIGVVTVVAAGISFLMWLGMMGTFVVLAASILLILLYGLWMELHEEFKLKKWH